MGGPVECAARRPGRSRDVGQSASWPLPCPRRPPGRIGRTRRPDADLGAGANDAILEVRGLSKSFRGLNALSDYDLDLPAGPIHGVIGPNGAGKTTLFHVLSGFLRPSSRHDPRSRARTSPASPAYRGRPARHRPDVPEHPAVRRPDRSSTTSRSGSRRTRRDRCSGRCSRAAGVPRPGARARRAGDGAARALRPRQHARPARPPPAVRRPAPARDRPGRRDRAADPPARRAERRHEPGRDPGAARAHPAASATSRGSRSSSSPTTSRW